MCETDFLAGSMKLKENQENIAVLYAPVKAFAPIQQILQQRDGRLLLNEWYDYSTAERWWSELNLRLPSHQSPLPSAAVIGFPDILFSGRSITAHALDDGVDVVDLTGDPVDTASKISTFRRKLVLPLGSVPTDKAGLATFMRTMIREIADTLRPVVGTATAQGVDLSSGAQLCYGY
jgi:hypothetical protein